MTTSPPPWAGYLIFGFAFAWPLHVYKYVPYLDGTLTGIFMSVLLVIWLFRLKDHPIRIPLEYWGSLLVAFVLAILGGGDETYIMVALTFIMVTQFTRNALWVEHIMWATTITICVLAIVNASAHVAGLIPTAYALESGITMTGPYSVSEGIYILALGAFWGFYLTFFSGLSRTQRSAALFMAFICISVLAGKLFLLRGNEYNWLASVLDFESPVIIAATLALIWLCARIVAKLWVTRESDSNLTVLLIVTIVGTLVYWSLLPTELRLYHAFLLGLAAGYALPDRIESVAPQWPKALCAGLAVFAGLNIVVVFPEHEQDSRNLVIAARNDLANNDYSLLQQRMNCLSTIFPKRTDEIYLWKTRASIRQGNLDKASKEFAYAARFWIENGKNDKLQKQVDLVRSELRDAVAFLPDNEISIANERALISLGMSDSALKLLKSKLDIGDAMLPTELTAHEKAFLYSALLGDILLYDELKNWKVLGDRHTDPLWKKVVEQTDPDSVDFGSLVYFIDRQPNEIRVHGTIAGNTTQYSIPVTPAWQKNIASQSDQVLLPSSAIRMTEGGDRFSLGIIRPDESAVVQFEVQDGKIRNIEIDESRLGEIPYTSSVYYHPWAKILQILK